MFDGMTQDIIGWLLVVVVSGLGWVSRRLINAMFAWVSNSLDTSWDNKLLAEAELEVLRIHESWVKGFRSAALGGKLSIEEWRNASKVAKNDAVSSVKRRLEALRAPARLLADNAIDRAVEVSLARLKAALPQYMLTYNQGCLSNAVAVEEAPQTVPPAGGQEVAPSPAR